MQMEKIPMHAKCNFEPSTLQVEREQPMRCVKGNQKPALKLEKKIPSGGGIFTVFLAQNGRKKNMDGDINTCRTLHRI